MTAVAIKHKEQILQRVMQGDYLSTIAHDLGLAGNQAIVNALSQDPDYQAAKEIGLERRLAKREGELEGCERRDVLRARELLAHTRWLAEREVPRRWGAHTNVTVDVGPDLGELLRDAKERARASEGRVIEGEVRRSVVHEPQTAAQHEAGDGIQRVDIDASD